jgi:hypothetical protein
MTQQSKNSLFEIAQAAQNRTPANRPILKVAAIIDATRLVVNGGTTQGLQVGHQFAVYAIGDEIEDPDTGESLGRLEIIKGKGIITHVQDRLATLESITRHPAQPGLLGMIAHVAGTAPSASEIRPFIKPELGDLVKPI